MALCNYSGKGFLMPIYVKVTFWKPFGNNRVQAFAENPLFTLRNLNYEVGNRLISKEITTLPCHDIKVYFLLRSFGFFNTTDTSQSF